jgi:type IV pilus assembly protein PilB
MASPTVQDRLGDLLVREGLVTDEQLQKGLAEARSTKTRIGHALVKLGFVEEPDLVRALARHYRIPAVDLSRVTVDARILRLVPGEVAMKHLVLPLRRVGRTLTVAMVEPHGPGGHRRPQVRHPPRDRPRPGGRGTPSEGSWRSTTRRWMTGCRRSSPTSWTRPTWRCWRTTRRRSPSRPLKEQIDAAPVVKFINGLLSDAVNQGGSDIHIEPYEREIRVRYRIDGALQEVMKPPFKMKAALTSRIKILADLNIAERRVPQDGRIKLRLKNKVVDFRVSTLPVIFGEKIVLRILDRGNLTLDLTKFGFEPKAEKDFMHAIAQPYGMVLVTGPRVRGRPPPSTPPSPRSTRRR